MRRVILITVILLLLLSSTNSAFAGEDIHQSGRPKDPSAEVLQPAAVIGAKELNELLEASINKPAARHPISSIFEPEPDSRRKVAFGINLHALLMALIVMVALSLSLFIILSHRTAKTFQ